MKDPQYEGHEHTLDIENATEYGQHEFLDACKKMQVSLKTYEEYQLANDTNRQIVRFRYKNMKGESSNRTAYVLALRFRYRKKSTNRIVEFFIGLEIENTQKQSINPIVLRQMFEQINNIFEEV